MFAVLVLSSVMVLTVTLLGLGVGTSRELEATLDDRAAELLAEAGLHEGVLALRSGGSPLLGDRARPVRLGDGLFWVDVTDVTGDLYTLRAAAMCRTGRAATRAVVRVTPAQRFPALLFAGSEIRLKTKALVDSYDPSLGSYASQVSGGRANDEASIYSNGEIDFGPLSKVHGDARPGPGKRVSGGSVTGSTAPLPEPLAIVFPTPPPLPAGGALTVTGNTSLPPGDYRFTELDLAAGVELRIEGPSTVVVDGDFRTGSGSRLVLGSIDDGVDVYVGGGFDYADSTVVQTVSGRPSHSNFLFFGDSRQRIGFGNHGTFSGTLYAPLATVTFGTKFVLYGALFAHTIRAEPHFQLHLDETAAELEVGVGDARLLAWEPTGFPERDLLVRRWDPFQLLDVEREDLPLPAEAWE